MINILLFSELCAELLIESSNLNEIEVTLRVREITCIESKKAVRKKNYLLYQGVTEDIIVIAGGKVTGAHRVTKLAGVIARDFSPVLPVKTNKQITNSAQTKRLKGKHL